MKASVDGVFGTPLVHTKPFNGQTDTVILTHNFFRQEKLEITPVGYSVKPYAWGFSYSRELLSEEAYAGQASLSALSLAQTFFGLEHTVFWQGSAWTVELA